MRYISFKLGVKNINYYLYVQVLTFLRTDRRVTVSGDTFPKPCISICVPLLCQALQSNGEFITPEGFRKRIQSIQFKKSGLPQWFLKPGTDLDFIPSSQTLLRDCGQQHNSLQIYRELFSEEVLTKLDKGRFHCIYICHLVICLAHVV